MSTTPAADPWYEIRLQGRLDPRWATRFDGMTLASGDEGTTVIRGPVSDQAALHGVLQHLRDLGLPLLSVARIAAADAAADAADDAGNSLPPPAPASSPGRAVERRGHQVRGGAAGETALPDQ